MLKGGLQGDLEMRIYALFMRCRAAPWLPCAISIDEIDFTAPSRKNAKDSDNGGNVWLQLLSDGERPPNLVFFATTNVRINVLEQLVDRLDGLFVGVTDWNARQNALIKISTNWGNDMKLLHRNTTNDSSCWSVLHKLFHFDRSRGACSYYQCVTMGMTYRSLSNIKVLSDLKRFQLESNPWPTLMHGPKTLMDMFDDRMDAFFGTECENLLDFLIEAVCRNILSGRVLIDLSRLRENIIVVDVEVYRSDKDLHFERTTEKHVRDFSTAEILDICRREGCDKNVETRIKKQNLDGHTFFSDEDVSCFVGKFTGTTTSFPFQRPFCHEKGRQGNGSFYVRSFVLKDQKDELGVWMVLARFSAFIEASHCTFVSDGFLKSMMSGAQSAPEDMNRDALQMAISQYITEEPQGVLVLPLHYARMQKTQEHNTTTASSQIQASEVWNLITSSWRCQGGKKKLFALVASENYELDSLIWTNAVVWQQSDYRKHLEKKMDDVQKCVTCSRMFSRKSAETQDSGGCDHAGNLWLQQNDRADGHSNEVEWVETNQNIALVSMKTANKSKWICCGKPAWEFVCGVRKHKACYAFDDFIKISPHPSHQGVKWWWCNFCCNSTSEECK